MGIHSRARPTIASLLVFLSFLYSLCCHTYTATYADDTVIMASSKNRLTASNYLQENLTSIENWLKNLRIKANETKSIQITFTLRSESCPPVKLNNSALRQVQHMKYLGLHLDQRLTWKTHLLMKRNQLGMKLRNLFWLLGQTSKLSLENKVLVYKAILKPVWTYGIPLWGVAAKSNIEIIQRFQSKLLRIITCAPWYISNEQIHRDLQIPFISDKVTKLSVRYQQRLESHSNPLARALIIENTDVRRLKRRKPNDLVTRYANYIFYSLFLFVINLIFSFLLCKH